jgi:hypothetical protein
MGTGVSSREPSTGRPGVLESHKCPRKALKVDRKNFEGIVKNLLQSKPGKREDVKFKNRKNREKLISPQK